MNTDPACAAEEARRRCCRKGERGFEGGEGSWGGGGEGEALVQ